MEFRFVPVAWTEILPEARRHYAALPSATDAFHEEQVLGSQHYRILVEGAAVGFVSIRERQVITQFALAGPYRHLGQPVFDRLKRFDQITTALVPTNDEFFLAHALDAYRDLAMQACFFALARSGCHRSRPASRCARRRHAISPSSRRRVATSSRPSSGTSMRASSSSRNATISSPASA
jgi:hypothetical protein